MDRFDDDTLLAELRALRPTPSPEFATQLDARVGAGFPRRPRTSTTAWPFVALADLWRGMSTRRRLVPVLTVALAALVVADAGVAISQAGTKSNPAENAELGMSESSESGGGAAAGEKVFTPAPSHARGEKGPSQTHNGGGGGAPSSAGET